MSEYDARKGKRYDAGKKQELEKHPNKNKTTRKGTRRA
jgi:hypothetical protein